MKQLPYRDIGAILSTSKSYNTTAKGSGLLVSSNLVLTVAHNICDRGNE